MTCLKCSPSSCLRGHWAAAVWDKTSNLTCFHGYESKFLTVLWTVLNFIWHLCKIRARSAALHRVYTETDNEIYMSIKPSAEDPHTTYALTWGRPHLCFLYGIISSSDQPAVTAVSHTYGGGWFQSAVAFENILTGWCRRSCDIRRYWGSARIMYDWQQDYLNLWTSLAGKTCQCGQHTCLTHCTFYYFQDTLWLAGYNVSFVRLLQ